MKYMVMECHPGYAVVLSDDGRFLKVANMHYEVGQTVTDVVEMKEPKPKVLTSRKIIYSFAAMAACLMLVFAGLFHFQNSAYASVYMTINPEVRIDVNRRDTVVDLEGVNDDGKALIEDYDYKKKDLDLVMDELVDLAIEMGFLHEGGQITLTLDADDGEWIVSHEDHLTDHLNEHLTEKMSVTVEVSEWRDHGVTIEIPAGTTAGGYDESDYGETAAPETEAPATETAPVTTPKPVTTPPVDDDPTDYDDPDDDPDDGPTDYDDDPPVTTPKPMTAPSVDDDPTDYDDPDDGKTDYDDVPAVNTAAPATVHPPVDDDPTDYYEITDDDDDDDDVYETEETEETDDDDMDDDGDDDDEYELDD